MEVTFYQFGVPYLRWEKDGHIYEAVKEQVEFFGKEFFEQDLPGETLSDCLIATEEDYDYAEDFAEALQKHYRYLREQEIM